MAEDTPSEFDVRDVYVDYYMQHSGKTHSEANAEFDRFLARVKREAARGALDGLIRDLQEKGRCAADSSLPDVSDLAEIIWHAQDEARTYRDRYYRKETP